MAGLIGGGTPAAPSVIMPPTPPEPVVMPVADPEAQKRQELKKMAVARSRVTTRSATILGNDDDPLG
jgi:hypothetical protein